MKRPRSATVARASAAITSAAFTATSSASISISMFMRVPTSRLEYSGLSAAHRRVFPASGRRYFLIDLTRSPRTGLVFVDRSAGFEYLIDDAPSLFHIVFPGKQR